MIKLKVILDRNYICCTCGKGKAKYTLTFDTYCCGKLVGDNSLSLCEKCFKELKKAIKND